MPIERHMLALRRCGGLPRYEVRTMTVKSELTCMGRVDGMGVPRSDGSYIALVWSGVKTGARHEIIISEGCAAALVDEIKSALVGNT
jgi:hypothetical protein